MVPAFCKTVYKNVIAIFGSSTILVAHIGVLAIYGCASRGAVTNSDGAGMAIETASMKNQGKTTAAGSVRRLWQATLPGYITDVDVDPDGSLILVSTAPDQDRGDGSNYGLSLLKRDGSLVWRLPWRKPIRSQALSPGGDLILASNYESQVVAYESDGQARWTIDEMCRPFFLRPAGKPRQLLCYHDDDAGSEVALDWLEERSGRKIRSFPTELDILDLKIAPDHQAIAMSMNRGKYVLIGPEGKVLREGEVPGEIIDLSIGSAPEHRVAILYQSKSAVPVGANGSPSKQGQSSHVKKVRRIFRFDLLSPTKGEDLASPHEAAHSVAQSEDGKTLVVGSNSKIGQWLHWSTGKGVNGVRLSLNEAEYHSQVLSFENLVLTGVNNAKLAALRPGDSEVLFEIPVRIDEGAMLYSISLSGTSRSQTVSNAGGSSRSRPALIVVAADDGRIQAWEWVRSQPL